MENSVAQYLLVLARNKRFPLRLAAVAFCFAESTDLENGNTPDSRSTHTALEPSRQMVGHPDGRRFYQFLRQCLYPNMPVDYYAIAQSCVRYAKKRVTILRNIKGMELFPTKVPLETVAIDVLGQLLTTKRGNRIMFVIT